MRASEQKEDHELRMKNIQWFEDVRLRLLQFGIPSHKADNITEDIYRITKEGFFR